MSAFAELLERVRRAVPVELLAGFHPLGLVDEYVRFLALKLARNDTRTLPPFLSPSYDVDQVWRTHMLHPQAYVATCCALLLGEANGAFEVIVYSPVPSEGFDERYANTLACYKERFGIAPNQDVWPPSTLQLPSPPTQLTDAAMRVRPQEHSATANTETAAPSALPPPRVQLSSSVPSSPPSPSLSVQLVATAVQALKQECSAASTATLVVPSLQPISPSREPQLSAHELSSPTQSAATPTPVQVPERKRSSRVAEPSPSPLFLRTTAAASRAKRPRSNSGDGKKRRGIVVYANVPFGRKYAIALSPHASVALLQQKIAEQVRIPIDQQSLAFDGRTLEDNPSALLDEFRIEDQSTIRVSNKRLSGGSR